MKRHTPFVLWALALGGLSLAVSGCPKDPNKNSMTFDSGTLPPPGAGTGGAGGTTGPLPTTIPGSALATFETSISMFAFSMYDEPTNLAVHNTGTPPSITFDGADGSPTAGSLKVTAPFSGANQYVDVQSPSFGMTNLKNFMGRKLHVRVRVDPGSTFAGQIQPYVDTTAAFIFVGTAINVMSGNDWHDYVVDLETALTRNMNYDNSKVILYGVHIGSGGAGMNATPVTFHVDSFSVDPPLAMTADAAADTGSTDAVPDVADAPSEAATDGTADATPSDGVIDVIDATSN